MKAGRTSRALVAAALRPLLTSPLVALGVWWLVGLSLAPLKPLVADVQRRAADSLQPLPDKILKKGRAQFIKLLNAIPAWKVSAPWSP